MPLCVAIIPARGGSKGVPRKNLRIVGGMPLIQRAVTVCLQSRMLDKVYVSTEDAEIAEVSRLSGAEVIDRPPALATDEASTPDVLRHACGCVSAEIVVSVQCTTPLMQAADIDGCIELLLRSELAEAACVICPGHDWFCHVGATGFLESQNFSFLHPSRRQDMPAQWTIEGSVAAAWKDAFMRRKTFLTDRTIGYPVKRRRLDIDDMEDIHIANLLLTANTPICYD